MESPFASTCLCRICYEEEEQSSTSMESPCACSGTVKIFKPDYTVPEKKSLVNVVVI
ncbi:hypothetical protein GW17_00054811, partial [Ensete ventricosum]